MNLGAFRLLTAGLPDNYEIVTHPGDATFWETDARPAMQPVAGAPGLIILDDGQEVTEQYLIPIRTDLDEDVDMPGTDVPDDWEVQNQVTGEWVTWSTVKPASIPECLIVTARSGNAFYRCDFTVPGSDGMDRCRRLARHTAGPHPFKEWHLSDCGQAVNDLGVWTTSENWKMMLGAVDVAGGLAS